MGRVIKIGFCGPQRSGKTTAAQYLHDQCGATVLSLADPIKQIALDLFQMKGKDRRLLIGIGESLRALEPLVFCNALYRRIQSLPDNSIVVIDDVRSLIEWHYLHHAGFHLAVIHAPLEVRSSRPG